MKVSKNQSKALPKSEKKRLLKLVEYERRARENGFKIIGGIDEAGRGPLAGPVVAAACVIEEGVFFPGINDSKLLTPLQRQELYRALIAHPGVFYGVGIVEAQVIDKVNIYQATLLAMKDAVGQLDLKPDYLLVDGVKLSLEGIPAEKIIKGDQLSQSIAAASVIAKHMRDQIMITYHGVFPQYYFHEHKGYGTEKHKIALKAHGPCSIHRRSFAPVRELLDEKIAEISTPSFSIKE